MAKKKTKKTSKKSEEQVTISEEVAPVEEVKDVEVVEKPKTTKGKTLTLKTNIVVNNPKVAGRLTGYKVYGPGTTVTVGKEITQELYDRIADRHK